MTDWSALLDEFEDRLDRCRRLLESSGGTDDPIDEIDLGPWPPADATSEPLPPQLADRARRCLERADELEKAIVARRAELPALRPTVRNRRASGFSSLSTHL